MVINQAKKTRRRLWIIQEGRCYLCGKQMSPKHGTSTSATLDHVIPKAGFTYRDPLYGLVHSERNLMLACWDCNGRKGDTPLREYMRGPIPDAAMQILAEADRICAEYEAATRAENL